MVNEKMNESVIGDPTAADGEDTTSQRSRNEDDGSQTTSLEDLRELRRPARRRFPHLEAEILGLLDASRPDLDRLKVLQQELLEVFDEIINQNNQFLQAMVKHKISDQEADTEYGLMSQFRQKANAIHAAVEKMASDKVAKLAIAHGATESGRKFKLPEMKLLSFSGEIKDWMAYWGQFERTVDGNPELDKSEKFLYLLNSLKEGTIAYKLVSRFPRGGAHYDEAVEQLKRRFANPNHLMQYYSSGLMAIALQNVTAKQKMPLSNLFVEVDSRLRALDSLNWTDADPKTLLVPLLEGALPLDVLEKWQRSDASKAAPFGKGRIQALMSFMADEVEVEAVLKQNQEFNKNLISNSEDRLAGPSGSKHGGAHRVPKPTIKTMGFNAMTKRACIFCSSMDHANRECSKAIQKMTFKDKMKILRDKGLCFTCTLAHRPKACRFDRDKLKCSKCGKGHFLVLCKEAEEKTDDSTPPKRRKLDHSSAGSSTASNSNQVSVGDVCLPTLRLKVCNGQVERKARVFLDTGSSRSYILKQTAVLLKLIPMAEENVVHCLFGDRTSGVSEHRVYDLTLKGMSNDMTIQVIVRDQTKICSKIKRMDWLQSQLSDQLFEKNITLSDLGAGNDEIGLMIGADIYGHVMTGKKVQLSESLYAFESIFGWTVMGEVDHHQTIACQSISMTVNDKSICKLWDLDLMGIRDSLEVLSENDKEQQIKQRFMEGVTRNPDGRYVVKLPWKDSYPHPPSNKYVAARRLDSASRKLKQNGLLTTYNNLLRTWVKEDYIELLEGDNIDITPHHYVPHRAVVKPGSLTTPVRPVFDASCKVGGNFSLNECLHTGQPYVQLIPNRILKFRERPVWFISDIKKAFQMIEVHEEDRDFLRFLWWKNKEMTEHKTFRHKRVPFGATCSPFILNAILEHHLKTVNSKYQAVAERLWGSLYVDNCSSSENTPDEYLNFKKQSIDILAEAGMDLRMWLSNTENVEDKETGCVSVLGIMWDRKNDELFLDVTGIAIPEKVTKRSVLSTASKIFDPVGFSSPAILPMKLLLQRTWLSKLSWDAELPANEKREFLNWCSELGCLQGLKVPRLISGGIIDHSKWELHTFTDGSKLAFGAVVYLKTTDTTGTNVQLLSAKARVAPTKPMSIPRLELLGCLIGARLANEVKNALDLQNCKEYFHTDSSTALAWIIRNDQLGTFVGNRTMEVNRLTKKSDWRHLPGKENPADLPSRGCSPGDLVGLRWFEGPAWLYKDKQDWPASSIQYDEEEINKERRKIPIKTVVTHCCVEFDKTYSFHQLVRIQAMVRRFIDNCRCKMAGRPRQMGRVTATEMRRSEMDVIAQIQKEAFSDEKGQKRLESLETIFEDRVIRVKTRITNLEEDYFFKFPSVLPGEHQAVKQLIIDTHKMCCHAGVGFLQIELCKKYWILKSRQSIKKVISRCRVCRRYSARNTVTPTAPLPLDRIKSAEVFEVVGIDLAGPFITKNGKKTWIVLYTCAVYRAVHLDLVLNISTNAFLKSLERFIARYRRPSIIHSDNGTNFRGAYHLFKLIDWTVVQEYEPNKISKIEWRFNPPTASWWGGWWERLIRTMKDLLRKEIGQALLNKTELGNVLKVVEEVMNHRPLTYVSESLEDLEPLTPALFLHPLGNISFPEIDLVDGDELRKRYKYLKTIQRDLKIRFKKEYIALLISRNPKTPTRPLKVGELVIVGNDNKKRSQWPLGRILELYPGKDGVARVAKIKTADGIFTRPVPRLYPLEADTTDVVHQTAEVRTRSGRVIKNPRSQ